MIARPSEIQKAACPAITLQFYTNPAQDTSNSLAMQFTSSLLAIFALALAVQATPTPTDMEKFR